VILVLSREGAIPGAASERIGAVHASQYLPSQRAWTSIVLMSARPEEHGGSHAEILELGVVAAMLTGWTKLMFTFDLVTREDNCPIG
jgi:hypothetical protein